MRSDRKNFFSPTVKRIIKKITGAGSLSDHRHSGHPSTSQQKKKKQVVRVLSRVEEHQTGTVLRSWIFLEDRNSDLHLHTYKNQQTRQLKPTDHVQRREFVEWTMKEL